MSERPKHRYSGDSSLAPRFMPTLEREEASALTREQALNLIGMVIRARGCANVTLAWTKRRTLRLRGKYSRRHALITLHVPGQNRAVLLHELAHHIAPPRAAHGPEFARVFESLLREFAGEEVE